MSEGLPCINPTCDHRFPHSDIRGAAALTCPKCGNFFQLGESPSPTVASETAQPPVALRVDSPPSAPIPIAWRVGPAQHSESPTPTDATPSAGPVASSTASKTATAITADKDNASAANFVTEDESSALDDESLGHAALMAARRTLPTPLWKRIAFIFALGSIVIGLPLMATVFIFTDIIEGFGDDVDGDIYRGKLYNTDRSLEQAFRIAVPSGTWKERARFKHHLKAAVALELAVPNPETDNQDLTLLSVAGKDYGREKPRDAELLKEAIQRLEHCFGSRLEIETTPEIVELDGKRALSLFFRGQLNQVDWIGRCYALTHHGFGYWVFVAGTDPDLADQLFSELQQQPGMGFRIKTKRSGWSERPPEMVTYRGVSAPIQLKVRKGQWLNFKAKDVDAQGEIFLHSKDEWKFHHDHEKEANILVMTFKKKTANLKEAMKIARIYVAEKKEEENQSFQISLADADESKEEGIPKKIGNRLGQVVELKMESGDPDYVKYILLAVLHEPERFYVIQCESFWQYRQAWRGDFLDMLTTVRVTKE